MKNNRKQCCFRRSNYTKMRKKMNMTIFYLSRMPMLKISRHNERKIIWKHFVKDISEYFQKFGVCLVSVVPNSILRCIAFILLNSSICIHLPLL